MKVWLIGMSCAGKSTLARLAAAATGGAHLDGDMVRATPVSEGLGFTPEERALHLARVGTIAQWLDRFAPHVFCSFQAPTEAVRRTLPIDLLVYVRCSVETCMVRDVKGLWAKARAGEIQNLAGYDVPYEDPTHPDLVLDTDDWTVDECLARLLRTVAEKAGDVR